MDIEERIIAENIS